MKRIETYTVEEAEILIKYYSDKVVNSLFDKENGLRITTLETEKTKSGKVLLNCIGYSIKTSFIFTVSIKTVAQTLDLEMPENILKK